MRSPTRSEASTCSIRCRQQSKPTRRRQVCHLVQKGSNCHREGGQAPVSPILQPNGSPIGNTGAHADRQTEPQVLRLDAACLPRRHHHHRLWHQPVLLRGVDRSGWSGTGLEPGGPVAQLFDLAGRGRTARLSGWPLDRPVRRTGGYGRRLHCRRSGVDSVVERPTTLAVGPAVGRRAGCGRGHDALSSQLCCRRQLVPPTPRHGYGAAQRAGRPGLAYLHPSCRLAGTARWLAADAGHLRSDSTLCRLAAGVSDRAAPPGGYGPFPRWRRQR